MSLRDELASLAHSSGIRNLRFPKLDRLARAAARAVPRGSHSPEDLVQEFWLQLMKDKWPNDAGGLPGLLALTDGPLEAAVRTRLRHLAVEAARSWTLLRALRAQVERALENLPETPIAPPPALTDGQAGHFKQELVAKATAWLLAQPDAPGANVREVSRQLLGMYFPQEEGLDDRDPRDPRSVLDDLRRKKDGKFLADVLERALEADRLDILLRRYRGDTFGEIAEATGLAMATVHKRCEQAIEELQSHIEKHGLFTPLTANRALQRLLGLRNL